MLFGINPLSKIILAILGLECTMIERFRDCGIENNIIWIYTRTGGNNREYYPNKNLINNKNYIKDKDDNFDSTYAMYEFSIPADKLEKASFLKELMDKSYLKWERPDWEKKFKELEMDIED